MVTGYVQLIAAMLIFGSIGIFVMAIPLASTEIVLVRTIVGSIFLLLLGLLRRQKINTQALLWNLPVLLASGIALGGSWALLFEAYRYITVSVATLILYFAPILVFLLSPLLLNEKLTVEKGIGVGTAIAGMLLINGLGLSGADPMRGLICGSASAALYALLVLLNKRIQGLSGVEITLAQLLVAAFVMCIYVGFTHTGEWILPSGSGMAALLVVGVVHTGMACYLYFSSMQTLPGQPVALLSYIDPLSTLLFSALFLGERLTEVQWLGAMLVLGGTAFGQLYRPRGKERCRTGERAQG